MKTMNSKRLEGHTAEVKGHNIAVTNSILESNNKSWPYQLLVMDLSELQAHVKMGIKPTS